LEILEECRRTGVRGVLEQFIAPTEVQLRELGLEREAFPGWERTHTARAFGIQEFIRREQMEWDAANLIVCPSNYVRRGLAECGVRESKIVVVPYGVERPDHVASGPTVQEERPLRVAYVGSVELRKGIQYLMHALESEVPPMDVRAVGPVAVSTEARRRLERSMTLVGSVPSSTVWRVYRWADVLVLPSVCEGSATVVYEALSRGVPAVVTDHTGSVVENGVDGFIVPVRDPEALRGALIELAQERELLSDMRTAAFRKGAYCSLHEYGKRLSAALSVVS